MEHDHWGNAQAIEEVKAFGYTNLAGEGDILGYLEHYQPTWKREFAARTQKEEKQQNREEK